MRPGTVKRLALIPAAAAVALATAFLAVYLTIRGSLPALDGGIDIAGLSAPVVIERDAYGVPTIRGRNRLDVARATGFVHGQERFFQMDLMRRAAAGELAALFGAAAEGLDRRRRAHRLRALARDVLANAGTRERDLLQAYADGVNAGLEALPVVPFEYLILRTDPQPWRPEDSALGNFAMFFQLTDDDASRESGYAAIHDGLPAALLDFVFAGGNEWDAPLIGDAWPVPAIPGPAVCDLRTDPTGSASIAASSVTIRTDDPVNGSNAWAVAAARTDTGRAIVANDMHLDLDVPNIWYRARLIVEPTADASQSLDLSGVMLPGTPFVVAGSNTEIAWGFTNSRGDWSDLILLELDPEDPDAYLTPDGYERFEAYDEVIEIKDAAPQTVTFRWTRWGPAFGDDHRGRPLALRWLAHLPEAVNFRLFELETARNIHEAIALAPLIGVPPQNLIVADAGGAIGWTIMGRIPRRVGYDSALPAPWADGRTGWQGWLAAEAYPKVIDPGSGFVWTANARVTEGEVLQHMGAGGYTLGARARQIRDALASLRPANLSDMLAIQLDDRALLQQRWRDLLVEAMTDQAVSGHPLRAELRAILRAWEGRAGVESVGYRMTREFRRRVHDELLAHLLAGCGEFTEPLELTRTNQAEGPVWRLVTEQPAHLLPGRYDSWNDLLLAMA
ncbi:MAG: penicillin acylase family protein, partial [Rhodospirillaceae bacterium]|nr:penicillin acylase family protein [Rhodospirillaceae bacterium]